MLTNFFTVGPDFNFDRSNFHILDGFGQTKIVVRSRKLRRIVKQLYFAKKYWKCFCFENVVKLVCEHCQTSSVRVWIGVYIQHTSFGTSLSFLILALRLRILKYTPRFSL